MFNTIPAVPFTPPYYQAATVKVTFFYASDADKQKAYDEAHQLFVKRVKAHKAKGKLDELADHLASFCEMEPPKGSKRGHQKTIATYEADLGEVRRAFESEYDGIKPCPPDEMLEVRAKLMTHLVTKVRVDEEEHVWPDTLENQVAMLKSLPPRVLDEVIDGLFYELYDAEAPGKS